MSLVKTSESKSEIEKEESDIKKITSSIQQYIVRPLDFFGVSGFVFDVEGETKITHTSNITDNYVEDNSTVQDHIASAPLKISLSRYVGELVDKKEDDSPRAKIASLVQKLAPVSAFLPSLTQASSFAKNAITEGVTFDENLLSESDNLYSIFKNLNPNASKKQKAYIYFKALADKGVLLSVETPFSYYRNMAIESLIATESEETRDIANFSITLKQVRFASVSTVKFDKTKFQNRAKSQNNPVEKKGKAQGKKLPESFALNTFNKLKDLAKEAVKEF